VQFVPHDAFWQLAAVVAFVELAARRRPVPIIALLGASSLAAGLLA